MRVAEALKVFDVVASLTVGGPGNATQSVSYLAFRTGLRFFDVGYASAIAYPLLAVVMVVVTLFFKRVRTVYGDATRTGPRNPLATACGRCWRSAHPGVSVPALLGGVDRVAQSGGYLHGRRAWHPVPRLPADARHFRTELSTPEGFRALRTSIVVSVSATLLALVLGMPAAYALARFRFWSNADITVWFLSQRVLVPVATLIPFYLTFRAIGLLDTPLALILVNTTFVLPFVVVIDAPDVPRPAGRAGGSGPGRRRRFLWCLPAGSALPLAAPAAAATAMIIFAFTWNEFLFSSSLGITRTKMMPAQNMAGAVDTRGVQFWFMATRALIAMVPPVLLALIALRYIVRGLTLGAVKG